MKRVQKQLRKREYDDDDNEGTSNNNNDPQGELAQSIGDVLELRKLKKKARGLDHTDLIKGDPELRKEVDDEEANDPWKLKSGGLVDLREIRGKQMLFGNDPAASKGSSFAAASNTMDTEKKMNEFIERELAKKRNATLRRPSTDNNAAAEADGDVDAGEDDELLGLPKANKNIQEGNVTLSAAMLTAIPEVDLGIIAKLKNIEQTELARQQLIAKQQNPNATDITAALVPPQWSNNRKQHKHSQSRDKGSHSDKSKKKFDKRSMATDEIVEAKFKKRNRK